MNYKLKFWDDLFTSLIEIHLVNGNHFDGLTVDKGSLGKMSFERLDLDGENGDLFLRYTFEALNGDKVVYVVRTPLDGSGLRIELSQIVDDEGVVRLLDKPSDDNENIMSNCFDLAVKAMKDIWYE